MKSRLKLFVFVTVLVIPFCVFAGDKVDAEPTDAELEYMGELDADLGDRFGGNADVEYGVVKDVDTGARTIIMDYSGSKGMQIKGGN